MKKLTALLDEYIKLATEYGYMSALHEPETCEADVRDDRTRMGEVIAKAKHHIDRAQTFMDVIVELHNDSCDVPITHSDASVPDGWYDNRACSRREYWRDGSLVWSNRDTEKMDPKFGSLRDLPTSAKPAQSGVAKHWPSSPRLKAYPHIRLVDGEFYQCACGSSCSLGSFGEWSKRHCVPCANREATDFQAKT